ncbi:MAG TPA: glycosyltransferase [Gammaproteobacteria bacterium]|nr:glycosyltransferase [Gammaproteobacteria bacterium]
MPAVPAAAPWPETDDLPMDTPALQESPLSVIIPMGPGENEAQGLLDQLHELPDNSEVIVVNADNGKTRRPAHWPATLTCRGYVNNGGRARQMNLGARIARGDWLWFVHADSRLLPKTLPALHEFINQSGDALGWFHLRFRNDGPGLCHLNAWGANLRSHWWGLPFGDQGLVLKHSRFEQLGGFDESLECGEDHHLVWQAHGHGLTVKPVGAPLATSARKYAERGWFNITSRHVRLTFSQAIAARRSLRKPG